jgi:hypothetical protein
MRKSKRIVAAGCFVLATSFCFFFATSSTLGWVPQCAIDGSCRILDGRMTGGGSIFMGTEAEGDFFVEPGTRITHGFQLHCDVNKGPNNLQIQIHRPNGEGGNFHLDHLNIVYCYDSPAIDQGKPAAPFDSLFAQGVGRYNGVAGYCADWEFTDAGEPGVDDQILSMRIWQPSTPGDCSGGVVPIILSSNAGHTLTYGNHQAHKSNKK